VPIAGTTATTGARDRDGVSRWPNLFVVGVARAGTSSIAAYLGQHPDVFMSPRKEPYFFTDDVIAHAPFPKDDDAYLRLFSGSDGSRWRAEASTAYFWDPTSPGRIGARCADARIVVSLREPVARAYSGYWHAVQVGGEARSFDQAVRDELAAGRWRPGAGYAPGYVEAGWYVDGLARWSAWAGDRLHLLFFEDLARDPRAEMRRMFAFLGVDPQPADHLDLAARNASVAPRGAVSGAILRSGRARRIARHLVPRSLHRRAERALRAQAVPPMSPATRETLTRLYRSERDALRAMVGRPLPW
jgi:hypothetical protein